MQKVERIGRIDTPIVSSLVALMSIEELRSFSQVLANIRLTKGKRPNYPNHRGGGHIMLFISPVSSLLLDFASLSCL